MNYIYQSQNTYAKLELLYHPFVCKQIKTKKWNIPISKLVSNKIISFIFDCFSSPEEVSSGLEEFTGKLNLCQDKPDILDFNKDLQPNISDQQKETSLGCVPHFAPLYISVIESPDTKKISSQMTVHEKTLLLEYEQREGLKVTNSIDTVDCAKGWGGEEYESTALKHGDKAFHKFNKQLHACPQQCLR